MKSKIKIYSLSALILAVLLTALRLFALIFSFDHEVAYFNQDFLPIFFRSLTIAAAAWCLTALVLIPKGCITAQKSPSIASAGISTSSAVLFILSGLMLALNGIGVGILLILGGMYPLCRLFAPEKISICAGMLLTLSLAAIILIFHFDMYVPINSPLKNAVFLSVLTGALFLVSELRFLFGDGMPRFFLSMKLICPIFCLPTAVGNLFLYFSDKTPLPMKQILSPFFSLALLAMALYAAFGSLNAKENEEISKNT